MAETFPLPEGARFVLSGADGWPPTPAAPRFDVSGLPGARVVLDERRGDAERFVRVACVTAPTDRWAPGLEDTVLGYATWIAHKSLAAEPIRLAAGAARAASRPSHLRQPLASADAAWRVSGAHELGFVGASSTGLVCSFACVEREASEACARVARESRVEASFQPEPPPSLAVRALLGAAAHPLLAGAIVGVAGLGVAALWIARRERGAA